MGAFPPDECKTSAYTVVKIDDGTYLALGGNAFYTLTFGGASTYNRNFRVRVRNSDSGRGKTINLNGTAFILWPLQTIEETAPRGRSSTRRPVGPARLH